MLHVNFSVKPINFAPKWSISYFQPILVAIFVTKAKVNVKVILDFYTLVIVLINYEEQLGEKQFLYFSLIGGPKKPLNAHSSFTSQEQRLYFIF